MKRTLRTMGTLDRNDACGMFYNWYDEHTGAKLTHVARGRQHASIPFLSSVDNGWFAAALRVVAGADPRLRAGDAALPAMNFGFYDNAKARTSPGGLIRGGFWDRGPARARASVKGNYRGRGPDVCYTCNHYRHQHRAAPGDLPGHRQRPDPAQALLRHAPHLPERAPATSPGAGAEAGRRVADLPRRRVFEGAYTYRGMRRRAELGRRHVRGADGRPVRARGDVGQALVGHEPQADRQGPDRARPGRGGLRLLGLQPGVRPVRHLPRVRRRGARHEPGRLRLRQSSAPTSTRAIGGCPGRDAIPTPTFGDGVVTPHAAFLALPYATERRRSPTCAA